MSSQGHYLLCPVCKKTRATLSVHLRQGCMKGSTPEAIEEIVQKAQDDAREILQSGRIFNYSLLCQIVDDDNPVTKMIEELQRRHMVVTNVPPSKPNNNATLPSTSITTQTSETETGTNERSAKATSRETCNLDVQGKNNRELMAARGLYNKHALDHPLLKDFATYLEKDIGKRKFKQEVENVARFLYYMDPQAPSLEFVRNREKTKQYLRELTEAKLMKQTQVKYLKSLKRFLIYHTIHTNLRYENERLHGDCSFFLEYIKSLQISCSKLVNKEITQKKHQLLTERSPLTPHDCWAVLKAAKKDFLRVIGKVYPEVKVTLKLSECSLVVRYLEAVLVLKHLQRPGVVENMTVQEWTLRQKDQTGLAIIGVKEHKTSAQQVATFALSQEEELWFEVYFTHVRPQLLTSKKSKRSRNSLERGREERFFISTAGTPIYSASSDVSRLHSKYHMESVTSQMARRAFETATKDMTNLEKSLVADYLAHSTKTAEKHYRIKQAHNVALGCQLLAKLGGDSSAESADEGAANKAACGSHVQTDVQAAYDKLVETHPVILDGKVPDRTARSQTTPDISGSYMSVG